MAAIKASVKAAFTLSCTIKREEAVHFWPVPPKAPFTAQATAKSKSQSSIITSGFFEPISICNLVRFGAAAAAMSLPTSNEPVKLIALMPGWEAMALPISAPEPITRLNRPAGKSCLAIISVNATALAGTRLAGFQITALPKANAGAIFHTAVAVGKFQGEMIATTPTASRRTSISILGRTESAFSPN